MAMKSLPQYFFQLGALSLTMMACWSGFMALASDYLNIGPAEASMSEVESMLLVLAVCVLQTVLSTALISQSSWKGFKLIITFFIVMFGIQFLLTQAENYFLHGNVTLPDGLIEGILIAGGALSLIYSIAAVVIMGFHRIKNSERYFRAQRERRSYSAKFYFRLLFSAAVIYPAIYFLAGYFILWQFEAARLYYANSSNKLPFLEHMQQLFSQSSGSLYFLQVIRGAIWTIIGMLLFNMLKSHVTIKAILIALTFSLFMGLQLLIPNPFMPTPVRHAHLLELLPSNFIWGIVLVWFALRPSKKKALY
ncbi:hypothetical protein R9C00_18860 [Flammeovirgaceae bacterium SG7u.111]|nr:hypothetical protein [Flammeovirgaceae bacterium SG7u.132]WPO33762.1 hypothetical protein R9C00_18860 [Flammeovirgaceae bacterium SG7u.111]